MEDWTNWKVLYEAALRDQDSGTRWQRIMQAQESMLQWARILEDGQGSDADCLELETAAEILGRLKDLYSTGQN